ncbi:GNAT family N-acetyltransferase [Mumia sp. Pv 4-285]|uniref:GNAT family N-acetyltransferase n=1 Tax=Mumia qirimensis TaxID=3234852 RepID=UPI00351DA54C
MEIRPEADHDTGPVAEVVLAAFGADEKVVVDLVEALRASSAYRGDLALVAVDRGEVVGHVMVTRGWIDAPDRLVEVGVLSPLSVRPDHQGAGLGTALLERAVTEARRVRWPLVVVEGSPRYYGARGFERADLLGLQRPSARIPAPAFQVARLPAYDESISGTVVYPDPFWALDCVGLRDPELVARIEADG